MLLSIKIKGLSLIMSNLTLKLIVGLLPSVNICSLTSKLRVLCIFLPMQLEHNTTNCSKLFCCQNLRFVINVLNNEGSNLGLYNSAGVRYKLYKNHNKN